MKTIKAWIDTLPQDIREKAYKYEAGSMIGWDEETPTLGRAIELAFSWNTTDEKFGYWQDVCELAQAGAFDQPEQTYEWTHERLIELVQFVYNEARRWVNAQHTMTTEEAEEILKDFQA